MWAPLLQPLASLAGSFITSQIDKQQAKSRLAVTRAEAEAEIMRTAASHDSKWELIMAKGHDGSWKDEAWTILFILIIAICFVPSLQPYVERGFEALGRTPDWFRYAIYASIGASFGLRGLKGMKR